MFARDAGAPKAQSFVSPDRSLALPAFRPWQQGTPDHIGWRFSDSLDAYGLVTPGADGRVLVTNESEGKTWNARVGSGGALSDLKLFADRGGESVVADAQGRVFVANGQIFVYGPDGKQIGQIDVPERPLQLLFGGPDKRTLFVLTHHSLYSVIP